MRIIAGQRRGWKLEPPEGVEVSRPIVDRVKESLFNILQTVTAGSTVLDLFAGVGSLGLEALSRGAEWVTFVEQDRGVGAVLRRNVEKLRYVESSRVVTANSLKLREGIRDTGMRGRPDLLVFDLIFIDPPYRMMTDELCRTMIGETLAQLAEWGAVAAEAVIVVRRESSAKPVDEWLGLRLVRTKVYGGMALDFLEPAGAEGESGVPDGAEGAEAEDDD